MQRINVEEGWGKKKEGSKEERRLTSFTSVPAERSFFIEKGQAGKASAKTFGQHIHIDIDICIYYSSILDQKRKGFGRVWGFS